MIEPFSIQKALSVIGSKQQTKTKIYWGLGGHLIYIYKSNF